ncbi:hypothetical protein PGTUg99_013312 [Puccinia graminis f. sp. tritici]|uniref:Uncharacterized protein n=1 Tax=Puccinia graminis f. sp. tritici TaxID=56615 RepID=A0A5B0LHM0_PUCGR|nr:hypothetical protein PGTUg99_013312 [Puccinia graminis f. sp. tritici]
MRFQQVLGLLVSLFTFQEFHCTSIYSLLGLKDSTTQPLIKKEETVKHFSTIPQLHKWLGITDSSTYETLTKKEPEIKNLSIGIQQQDPWLPQAEISTEPLLEKKEKWLSVSELLRSLSYFPTLEEQNLVKTKISHIPQLQSKDTILDKKVKFMGEIPTYEERENLMHEDFKSLRESCLRLQSSPKKSYGGYLNPYEYSELFNHKYTHKPIYQHLNELNQIHNLMEQRLPSLNAKGRIELLPIGEYANPDEEMGITCRKIIEMLLLLLCKIEPRISFEVDFHSLNVQRLICETIYYFNKHDLISPERLGPLLTTRAASQAFSRHIIWSFNHHQIGSKYWIPLSGTNLINSWFQFSCGNMFKDFKSIETKSFLYQFNKTLLEYYQYYPEEQKNPDLKDELGRFQRILFSQAPLKYHSREFQELEYYIMDDDRKTITKLVSTFKNMNMFRSHQAELTHLFQVLELFGTVREYDLEAFKKEDEFRKKFELMAISTEFLGRLENIRIHLQNKFNQSLHQHQWIRSIFDQPNRYEIDADISPLEELELIAKYLKIIEAEHHQKFSEISSFNPLSMYCQREIIQKSIRYLQSFLTDLASNL